MICPMCQEEIKENQCEFCGFVTGKYQDEFQELSCDTEMSILGELQELSVSPTYGEYY